ncbi:hypothetical protein [Streptomyces sp. URMC 129]|uniref:hypothetical protein n=1 Tax=Streptomyces sp. URMC 129 TaxID=3423407 RepID=UPI003F1ACFDC
MPEEIASHIPGRAVGCYDLLDELTEAYGLPRQQVHEGIHALLDQLVELDGEEAVVLDRRRDRDPYWRLTISDDALDAIREHYKAVHASA